MTQPTPHLGIAVVAVPDEVSLAVQRAEEAEARAKWSAAREHYSWALATLPVDSDAVFTGRLVRRIARCHVEEAEHDAALDCLHLARTIATAAGDGTGEAHAINWMGIAEQQRGNLDAAERHYRNARAVAEAAGAGMIAAMVSQNLGAIANIRGDFRAARAYYEESLEVYELLGAEPQIGNVLNNLGMLHTDLRDWRAAERCFSQAIEQSTAAGDVPSMLRAQSNRVELYLHLGRYRKAKRVCRALLSRVALGAEGQWVGETYKYMGVVYRETGDAAEAVRYLGRALAMAEGRKDLLLEAETLRELAVLHRKAGHNQETLTSLNRAHEIFTRLAARGDLSDIDRRLRTLETQFLEIVRRWGSSIESKDRYTQGHCERVAEVGCAIAVDAGITGDALLWFRMGGLLHDVGKVMVPEEILNKPGQLTQEERAIMNEHPANGEKLVADARFPMDVMPMIRHHHERWDGNGYPDKLAGETIPFWARILCIADVYDALTTARSYRKAFNPQEALTIMRSDSGRAFDPQLLDIFLAKTWPALQPPAVEPAPQVAYQPPPLRLAV
jgi:putative nucleotidyltransferase with HDIG domain